jgi:hypothetical protein
MSATLLTAAEIARVLAGSTLLIQLATLWLSAPTTLTIASGVVTITQTQHLIDTEGAAASDDLDTVTGGEAYPVLILRPASGSRTVTLKHGTGNLACELQQSVALADVTDVAVLVWNGTGYTVTAYSTIAPTGGLGYLGQGLAEKVSSSHVATGSLAFAAGDTTKTAAVNSGFNGAKVIVCFGADPLASAGQVWGSVSGATLTVTLGTAPGGAGTTVNYLLYY